jgi:hypothetical protein
LSWWTEEEVWTEDEAFAWIVRDFGLSVGAAEMQLRIAWETGNVRATDETATSTILPDDRVQHKKIPISGISRITGQLVHRLLLHPADLRSQIRQQLGAPPVPTVKKHGGNAPYDDTPEVAEARLLLSERKARSKREAARQVVDARVEAKAPTKGISRKAWEDRLRHQI